MRPSLAHVGRLCLRLWSTLTALAHVHLVLRWCRLCDALRPDRALSEQRRRRQGRPVLVGERLEPRWLMSGITEYTITPGCNPLMITNGGDGNVWFTYLTSPGGGIGKITPSGTYTLYSLGTNQTPWGIAGDGSVVWFTEQTLTHLPPTAVHTWLGTVDTSTGIIGYIPVEPNTTTSDLRDVCVGNDGNIWFVDQGLNQIVEYNVTTLATVTFNIPTANAGALGICPDPDSGTNAVWFTEQNSDKIGRLTSGGTFTEYTLTDPSADPLEICGGADGNLWFSCNDDRVGVFNVTTHADTEYQVLSSPGTPYGVAKGPDGNVWFPEYGGDSNGPKIANVAPWGTMDEVAPVSGRPKGITVGPDNWMWVAEYSNSKIGKLVIDGTFQRNDDPTQGTLVPVGPGLVSPGTGDYSDTIGLDPCKGGPT